MSWARAFAQLSAPCCCEEKSGDSVHVVQLSVDAVIPAVHKLDTPAFVGSPKAGGKAVPRWLRERLLDPGFSNLSPKSGQPGPGNEELQVYQDGIVDLIAGLHLTHVTANQEYADVFCKLMPDLATLQLEHCGDVMAEFPLGGVLKIYRIVKAIDQAQAQGLADRNRTSFPFQMLDAEHIVVIQFPRRKLAFVFADPVVAQRFLLTLEVLIGHVQEEHAKPKRVQPLF
ncbi:unnamed protein product [Effrenium voratum]|nr:unnamed protein product [Effrenium voratum]